MNLSSGKRYIWDYRFQVHPYYRGVRAYVKKEPSEGLKQSEKPEKMCLPMH